MQHSRLQPKSGGSTSNVRLCNHLLVISVLVKLQPKMTAEQYELHCDLALCGRGKYIKCSLKKIHCCLCGKCFSKGSCIEGVGNFKIKDEVCSVFYFNFFFFKKMCLILWLAAVVHHVY